MAPTLPPTRVAATPALPVTTTAPVQAAPAPSHRTSAADQQAPAETAADQQAPAETAADQQAPAETAAPVEQPAAPVVLAAAPSTIPRRVGVAAAARAVSEAIRSGGGAQAVRAALADITPADLPTAGMEDPWLRDSYIGQLWTAAREGRPWIDLAGAPGPITGLRVYGWRWTTKPVVGNYAGNKAEIPTSPAVVEPAEAPVERTAGGWDIDRVYVDLGDASLIEALWTAAVEDYRVKTEAKAAAAIRAAGTAIPAATSLPEALVALGQAASAIGARINGVAVAPDVWGAFAGLTKDQVPWWLGGGDSINLGTTDGQVGGTRFWVDTTQPAGTLLAADSRAYRWFEKNPPVRVNAVDLPNGGVDLALMGYHGIIITDPRAIFTGTIA